MRTETGPCGLPVLTYALLVGTMSIWAGTGAGHERERSDVPMTRPEECLAALDGIGRSASFVELPDGSILIARGEGKFSVSRDGGLT